MNDTDFDSSLIAAAFRIAGREGWMRVSVVAACREAGLPLARARTRFPSRGHILVRFGQMADQHALTDAAADGPIRDRLFDLLMRRFDALNAHRDGVKALMRALPFDPATAMLLACATGNSMRWMLQAAGVTATGPRGDLQAKGLTAVWLWVLRTWEQDESEDLSQTMAAVDQALGRAEWFAGMLGATRSDEATAPSGDAGGIDTTDQPPPDFEAISEPPPDPDMPDESSDNSKP
ncbi:MAG: TetR family transcriptional regulator [Acetobacteraceae bacterium]